MLFSNKKMKTFRIILPLVFGFLLIMAPGCGKPAPTPIQNSTPSLVWPLPPEKPRIQYLYSISKPEDIGISPSFFEKAVGFLAGKKATRQMVRPFGTYFSRSEILYVTDPGIGVVHQFDMKNQRYNQISKHGKKNLVSPIGVTMDESGVLYVSDSILRKVFVFGPKGEPMREIGGKEWFSRPTGIAIYPSLKRLYVVETADHAIRVFDLQGKFLFSFGQRGEEKGEFNFPTSLAIDQNGDLYVNDSLNYRIQVFNPNGRFISMFGRHGDGMGEFSNPKGIAGDSEGHIYVADAIFDTVQIFNGEGRLLLYFGEAGQGPGEFWIPSSVFIDRKNRIFVADSYNQRVQVFKFLGGN
ncbi:MAG: 6-bladed beta-propeller [Thermodesulfobacteriota bacterium]